MSARSIIVVVVVVVAAVAFCACGPPVTPSLQGEVVGATSVDIDTRGVTTRTGEAPVGDFLADTLRDAVRARGNDVEAAMINAGTIRGGPTTKATVPVDVAAKLGRIYPAGPLTNLDVLGWDPFRDDQVVMTVTGAELKSALERGASQLPPDLRVDGGGPLLQVSGVSYTIDCAGMVQKLDAGGAVIVSEGTRVTRLAVNGHVLWDVAGGIDELATTDVRIVVNDFVARGFDGHVALLGGRDRVFIPYDELDLAHAAVERVRASSPIAPMVEGRITIVGDCGQPLSLP